MRVLMLSANTGEGHNSTARAIMEVLEDGGVECDLRDALACLSPRFSKFICNAHEQLYKYGTRIFDAGYRAMERTESDLSMVYDILKLGADKLWDMLAAGDYDAVVCVHAFSAMMLTEVRRVWGIRIPSFFVATDYTCSPTVEQSDMDGYFVPAADLTWEFVRAGIQEGLLIPAGIPVRQTFYAPGDRAAARRELDLPADKTVILLMCGSMGCGPVRRIVRELAAQLPENTMLAAVCGHNEKLYESLRELEDPAVRVLGFTRQIPQYMDAADLLVTKPGGLSTTEAANKHLPMVLINAVGGCESRNFDYFLSRGYALGSTSAREVVEQTLALAADFDAREHMRLAMARDFTVNAARFLADHVISEATQYRRSRKAGMELVAAGHPTSKKGGCDMHKSETVQNLARSFAGESQARTRYTVYAQVARKEGWEWIARIFEETAANEAVHAEEFLEHLQKLEGCAPNIDLDAGYPFQLGTTAENLAFAADGELHEHDDAYPGFAEIARREGFDDTARLWMQIARIEGVHHNTFAQLHEQLVSGTLTEKASPASWRCLNCGYTYEGIRACDPCPVCGKKAGWQEGSLDSRKLMAKKSQK